jgi:selenocysteine-specific elongation factor
VHVIATAGHVDHGKSTLVRALTGMEPDRRAEERRRGMTIDLGFAWTTIGAPGDQLTFAFVDVPGHERFVPNMLAGVGSVPAAMVVVAADEGWMPQTAEHVAALHALRVRHALLVVTRSDLGDPDVAAAEALDQLAATTLRDADVAAVAIAPDAPPRGLDDVRAALVRLARALPEPDRDAPVRLWVDRSFSIRGSGTVVTGTLAAGSLRAGDPLLLVSPARDERREVTVRGLQSLGEPVERVDAVARVAVNLRGVDKADVARGDALLAPGAWRLTSEVDVLATNAPAPGAPATGVPAAGVDGSSPLPREAMMHIGSAAVPVRVRVLGPGTLRLSMSSRLPLRVGDLLLLRDPARHRIVAGVDVVDLDPPPLRRRGAASARAVDVAAMAAEHDAAAQLRRRRIASADELRALGVRELPEPFAPGWYVDEGYAAALTDRLVALVRRHVETHPLEAGPAVDAVRAALELPDRALVAGLVVRAGAAGLRLSDGRVVDARAAGALPPKVAEAVAAIAADLAAEPFAAPDTNRLRELGLSAKELAAAERAGALLRIADGVVLLPDAPARAVELLAGLPQPFTVSQAREAWRTTRRVAVPLLEHLARQRVVRHLPDGTHELTPGPP